MWDQRSLRRHLCSFGRGGRARGGLGLVGCRYNNLLTLQQDLLCDVEILEGFCQVF